MDDTQWMLYGCNGYTGRLVVAEARRHGLRPVLAGRREQVVRTLAEEHGLPWRCFDIADPAGATAALADVGVLLSAAGPYSATAAPLLDACRATGTAYLDLDGDVVSLAQTFAGRGMFERAGLLAVPAVGFDVVPSDCLIAQVCAELPGTERLHVAWGGAIEPSRGTARTIVEAFPRGGLARRGGQLVRVPFAGTVRKIEFPTGPQLAASLPWGDLVTSWFTAGVEDVTTYGATSRAEIRVMRAAGRLRRLFGLWPVRRAVDAIVSRTVHGPSGDSLAGGRSWFLVQAERGDDVVTGTFGGPEGYVFTARSAVEAVRRVCAGAVERRGVLTPSEAFGADFAASIEGCAALVRAGAEPSWPSPSLYPLQADLAGGVVAVEQVAGADIAVQ